MKINNAEGFIERLRQFADSDKIALISENADGSESKRTYRELLQDVAKMRDCLVKKGICRGQRCLLIDEGDQIDFVISLLAVAAIGATAVPTKPKGSENSIDNGDFYAVDSDASLIIAAESGERLGSRVGLPFIRMDSYKNVDDGVTLVTNAESDTDMLLLYTSGSTGNPRGVLYPETRICKVVDSFNKALDIGSPNISLCCLPLNHTFALISFILAPLWSGGCSIILRPEMIVSNPVCWFETVHKYKVTCTGGPNYLLSLLTSGAENCENEHFCLDSIKRLILGAEVIRADTIERFVHAAARFGFCENRLSISYGLTESCSAVTLTPAFEALVSAFTDGERASFENTRTGSRVYSVGRPIEGVTAKILDNTGLETAEDGHVGEILLHGEAVFDGYTNSDEKPFITIDGDICLRTGDLGFILDCGRGKELFVCGRYKELIIIKGENYSPYQIETLTDKVLGEKGFSAAVYDQGKDTDELVLLIEEYDRLHPHERLSLFSKIRDSLIRDVSIEPAYALFMSKGSMLRTQSGKLRRDEMRKKLAAGELSGDIVGVADSNKSEIQTDISAEVVDLRNLIVDFIKRYTGITEIDCDANLLSLGLNSLLIQLLLSELNRRLGTKLAASCIIAYPTVNALAERVSEYVRQREDSIPSYENNSANTDSDRYSITDVQRAYIAGRNMELDWGGVPCQCYIERDFEELDAERFKRAVEELYKRHPSLRMTITSDDHVTVLSEFKPFIEVRLTDGETRDKQLELTRDEMTNTALPLDQPLLRIVLTRLDSKAYRLHMQIDMICCDAMSIYIFWNDLMKLYENPIEEAHTAESPALGSESDIIKFEADRAWWLERAPNLPPPPALMWNAKVDKCSYRAFTRKSLFIDKSKWQRIESCAERLSITPTALMLTLFSECLSAYAENCEFTLSLTTFGRELDEKSLSTIGDFTKLLLFAVRLRRESVADNALRIQSDLLNCLEHTAYTSLDLVRENGVDQLYPVVFTSMLGVDRLAGGRSPFDKDCFSQSTTPQVILDNQLIPVEDGVMVVWDVVKKAFADNILESMFDTYQQLIEQADDLGFWRTELRDLRSPHDIEVQDRVNRTYDNTIEKTCLADGFVYHAEKNPELTALIHKGQIYTYRELKQLADRFSMLLEANKVTAGDLVMLQIEKSPELIAAIIGVIRCGAVYLPMPHDQPESRQFDIYKKSGAKLIITSDTILTHPDIPRVDISEAAKYSGDYKAVPVNPTSTAYVIYTSGSTGTPKGVSICHDAAMNTISAVNRYLRLDSSDRLIGLSSVSFDLSVYDIFGALSAGAALVVPTESERIDPSRWLSLCKENNVTVWNTVPALMDLLLDYCKATGQKPAGLSLRSVILSGDWIPMELYGKLKETIPGASLISMGGATEASIWSNYYPVDKIEEGWASIPYGYPLPNQLFHVLDSLDRLCPSGVSGRLCIGGRGLSDGYYNEKELTEKAFFTHRDTGERLYDTGDYGRYDKDGCLIFLGRKDAQVKINGYRIELGEIQSALERVGYQSSVILALDDGGVKKLAAFIKTTEKLNEADIKSKLTKQLPGYFVPERILAIENFPTTANGKIDKKRLGEIYFQKRGGMENISHGSLLDERDRSVLELLCRELGIEDLTPESSLAELGISSLSLIRLAGSLEAEFGYRARVNDIIRYRRVGDFIDYYRNNKKADMERDIEAEALNRLKEEEELSKNDPMYDHPVMRIIREELLLPRVSSDELLVELGLSSLTVIRIANRLESYYGRRPTVHEMLRYQKVSDIIDFYDNCDMSLAEDTVIIPGEKVENPVLRYLCEILNLPKLTPEDSFARLGVSSLELIRTANRLEAAYGRRPSMMELAAQNSFQELIDYYEGMTQMSDEESPDELRHRETVSLYNRCRDAGIILWPEAGKLRYKAPQGALTPELRNELSQNREALLSYLTESDTITSQELTPLQMAYVVGRQNSYALGDVTAHYYVEYHTESIDVDRLCDAINELIVKNEILRTIITPEGRMIVNQTNPGYSIRTIECSCVEDELKLRDEMKNHRFELGIWPMFDIAVTHKHSGDWGVHIGVDCLILDGWSINMFLTQLIAAYTGKETVTTDFTFRQYLDEERRWLRGKPYYRDAQKYWTRQIEKLPPAPRLKLKTPVEQIISPTFGRKSFYLDEQRTFAFFERLKKYDLTPSAALCTAYMTSLSKFSESPDLTLNLTMFNRQPLHPDVQKVLGDFTNIALVGYKSSADNFIKRADFVSRELWNAIEYRSFSVINLLGQLAQKQNDVIAAPYVFTSLIDNEGERGVDIMKKAGFKEVFAQTQTPQVLLDHQLYLRDNKLLLVLDYVVEAFDDDLLSELLLDYVNRVQKLADSECWENIYE